MKHTLNKYEIADLLLADENAGWTRSGALALAEYLVDMDEDLEVSTEFDPVEIRCEYSEYSSLTAWAESYGFDVGADLNEDERDEAIRSFINDRSQLIEFDGGITVADF